MKQVPILLLFVVGEAATARPADDPTAAPKTLRVMTYNIHGGDPVTPTDRSRAALRTAREGKTESHLLASGLEKLKPDIVALEEASSKKFVEQLAKEMDMDWAYFPGGWQDPEQGWPEGIPTAILSRLPIQHRQNCPLALAPQRPKDLFTRGYGSIQPAQTSYHGGMLDVWAGQAWTMNHVTNTGLIPSNDIYDNGPGNSKPGKTDQHTGWPILGGRDPHPPFKPLVAVRLADAVLGKVQGKNASEVFGPMYEGHQISGNRVIVKFKHVGAD